MNLSKLLQYELWSREANWKILGGLGIAVFLCYFAFGTWHQVELHWLTSGERQTARAALTEIDSLENAGALSDQEWKTRTKEAQAKIAAAEAAAKTYRDNFLEMRLGLYLIEVEMDHVNLQRRAAGARELRIAPLVGKSTSDLRAALHKELD